MYRSNNRMPCGLRNSENQLSFRKNEPVLMWAMTSAVALPSPARARTQNGRWKPAWLTLHLRLNYFIATTVWSPTVSSSSLQPIEAETIHVPCVSATRLWNNLTIKFSLFQSYSIDQVDLTNRTDSFWTFVYGALVSQQGRRDVV